VTVLRERHIIRALIVAATMGATIVTFDS